jgi:hypothetical protein
MNKIDKANVPDRGAAKSNFLASIIPIDQLKPRSWRLMRVGRALLLGIAAAVPWVLPETVRADALGPNNFTSLGALLLTNGSYTINTSGTSPALQDSSSNTLFIGVIYGQGGTYDSNVAVFDFSSIAIGSNVTITVAGTNPVTFLSQSSIDLAGTIYASGTNGGNQGDGFGGAGGPGGGAGGSGSLGGGQADPGLGPGGGPGGYDGLGDGSWGDGGSFGGQGAGEATGWNPYLPAAPTYGNLTNLLQGGSGGGGTGKNLFGTGAGGGGGGGAVELGALVAITLENTAQVLANGGYDGSGLAVNAGNGSGGGIFLHAPTITLGVTATVSAKGGGGGRIAFLTQSGTVSGSTNGVGVGGGVWDNPGVITYGMLPGSTSGQITLSVTLNGNGQPVISFAGISGTSYQLQRSTSLLTGVWVDGQTLAAPANGAVQFTDSNPPVNLAFYRVIINP